MGDPRIWHPQVAVQAARRLHIGVRTVSYRLERVRAFTGYAATDPAHRFTLEAAVLGARLLDWPATPVQPFETRPTELGVARSLPPAGNEQAGDRLASPPPGDRTGIVLFGP